jgi:hypothetical protein
MTSFDVCLLLSTFFHENKLVYREFSSLAIYLFNGACCIQASLLNSVISFNKLLLQQEQSSILYAIM